MASMSNLQIQKLSGRENYNTWKFAVKAYLENEELWDYVNPASTTAADSLKGVKAKSKIILLVDPVSLPFLESATTRDAGPRRVEPRRIRPVADARREAGAQGAGHRAHVLLDPGRGGTDDP